MRSDNKRDGIKREHVIFTQACLRSRQRRANYVYVSASAGQIWSWGRGEGDLKKMCVPLEKSWLRPWYIIYEQNNRLLKKLNGRLNIMMLVLTL